jgi:hypothetical protein
MLALALVFTLGACATTPNSETCDLEYSATVTTDVSTLPSIKIAALASDDLLPLKVADIEGLLQERGLSVEIITFDNVQQQHAAFTALEVDALLTDMADAALMAADGLTLHVVAVVAVVAVTQELPYADSDNDNGNDNENDNDSSNDSDNDNNSDSDAVPSQEATRTYHETVFDIPSEKVSERVLAFSHDFLMGDLASGENTSPEGAAEAISTLIAAVGQSVGRINAASDDYRELFLQQDFAAYYPHEAAEMPTYPYPLPPDREQGEALLDWMFRSEKLSKQVGYDDLIFIPSVP